MAITNPNLMDGFDTNGTNVSEPSNSQKTDGYTTNEVPLSGNHAYMFKQWYANFQYLKKNGIYQWDASLSYNVGSFIMYDEILYQSQSDANSNNIPSSDDGTNWEPSKLDINALPAKTTPVDADVFVGADSANAFALKKFTFANLKATLTSYFSSLFVAKLPTVTGAATFTNSNNYIYLNGLGSLSGLEVGDVIKVTNSVSNNKEFTVEVIADANNIIVNQAHAGGTTTKSLINETATAGVTIEILAKWYNAPKGIGQGWVIMTGSRSGSVVYNNPTGRSIEINISRFVHSGSSGYGSAFKVDGFSISENSSAGTPQIDIRIDTNFTIGKGSNYEATGNASFVVWAENR